MVRRNKDSGEHEIVEERRAPLASIQVGRRTFDVAGIGKSLILLAAVATVFGSCVGTVMHIVGWDFVSVRGNELREVKSEIEGLHQSDQTQLQNQSRMQAALDSMKADMRTQTFVQCVILRRMDPSLLPAGCPSTRGGS